jgi:hypothetical protein
MLRPRSLNGYFYKLFDVLIVSGEVMFLLKILRMVWGWGGLYYILIASGEELSPPRSLR